MKKRFFSFVLTMLCSASFCVGQAENNPESIRKQVTQEFREWVDRSYGTKETQMGLPFRIHVPGSKEWREHEKTKTLSPLLAPPNPSFWHAVAYVEGEPKAVCVIYRPKSSKKYAVGALICDSIWAEGLDCIFDLRGVENVGIMVYGMKRHILYVHDFNAKDKNNLAKIDLADFRHLQKSAKRDKIKARLRKPNSKEALIDLKKNSRSDGKGTSQ
jgi:hypothetical protein